MTPRSPNRIPRAIRGWWCVTILVCPALAEAEERHHETVGIGDGALPALIAVAVPLEAPRLSLAGTVGYGYTEPIGAQSGGNHRTAGTIAGGYSPAPWIAMALRIDGRYDRHPADTMGDDYTMIADPRVVFRLRHDLTRGLHTGAEALVWFPGRDAPSIHWASTSPEGRALLAWSDSSTTLAASAGFRHDRSAGTLDEDSTPRAGDLISSGVSDFDALLLGVGGAHRFGAVTAMFDATQDLLVGSGAPPASKGPLLLSSGARANIGSGLAVDGFVQVAGNGRANPDEHRVRVWPRLACFVGLRYSELSEPRPKAAPAPTPSSTTPRPPTRLPPRPVAAKPVVPKVVVATLSGTIMDEGGNPIPDVLVVLRSTGESPQREVRTDGAGAFRLDGIEFARYLLKADTPGFDPIEREIEIGSETPDPVEVTLYPALPAGQLRGLVRAFDGTPLKARLKVSPDSIQVESAEDGTFSIDVPPGTHTIQITAEGHLPQVSTVRVEDRGVTVINADLRRRNP